MFYNIRNTTKFYEVFYCTSENNEVYLQRQTNKECKFEQQESWRLQKPLTTYLIGKCSC